MQHWPGHGPCLLPRNMAACIPACIPACMPACMHTVIIRIRSVLSWLTSSCRGRNRKNENWKKKINRLYIYKRQGCGRSPWACARQTIKFRVHRAVSPAERRGYTSTKATMYTYTRAPHSMAYAFSENIVVNVLSNDCLSRALRSPSDTWKYSCGRAYRNILLS